MNSVTAQEFLDIRQQSPNAVVIDLRTPAEVNSEKLENCECIPVHTINAEKVKEVIARKAVPADQPIYLLCQSGKRAEMAIEKLANQGFSLVILAGGLNALKQAGAKLVSSGKNVMSLERQVRITAGALVAIGFALGVSVNPVFHWLSGFVGCGLVFAGVTDTCAMGMIIARMPWNQAKI